MPVVDQAPPVLLVDDDDALRTTTIDILHLHGFPTHGAPTGRAAIEMAHDLNPPPVVALVDLRLPDMNGLDLTHELREFNHELQVVILTGNATVETAIRALRDENCDYLLKPIEPTQLVRTLRTAAGRWKLRRTQAELERMQQVLRATFEASPLPIVAFDEQDRVTLWNPAAERVFGWSADEVMHRTPRMVPPDDARATARRRAASLRGESFVGIEVRRVRRDGSTVDVRLSQAPLTDSGGGVSGVLAVLEDITERRRIEDHLRESQRLDAIGRLAGGMAHDFNNLLAVILGEVDLALDDPALVPTNRETLESVRHAATSGATLTRQLLTFARRQKTELTVFNANLLLMELDRLLHRLVGDRVSVQADLAADLGSVRVDRQQLEQVVTNLGVNARDAMPEGGTLSLRTANVTIDARQVPPGHRAGEWVVIEVVDTGTGIPDDVRERLFEPFFTTKEAGKGTGLGLATSYGIVERFGGFITVDSEMGRGSTFRVFLPRVEQAPAPVPQKSATALGGNETVLIVEDRPELQDVATRILTARGYRVRAVSTGVEADEALRTMDPRPDLVLVDVNLPDGNGAAIAMRLRELAPALKVLLTSGAEGQLASGGEAFTFLPKPFGAEDLAKAVRAELDASTG